MMAERQSHGSMLHPKRCFGPTHQYAVWMMLKPILAAMSPIASPMSSGSNALYFLSIRSLVGILTSTNHRGGAQKAAGATSVARFRLARGSKTGPPQPGKRVIGGFRVGLLETTVEWPGRPARSG